MLVKPWENAKKSQKFIHYYLVVGMIHTTYSDDSCCYCYLLIPTTTKYLKNNKSLLKINSKDWFDNKDIYLKLDEIFVLQDFDFKTWVTFGEGKVCDFYPKLNIYSTMNIWKLSNVNVWNKISEKLYENFKNCKTMFFILNRKCFQLNSNYWYKKIKSKYIYNTDAFIPEWHNDLEEFMFSILNKTNDIRCNGVNINNINLINKYKLNHFDINNDKEKIKKYDEYFKEK